jgi:putative transposase
MARRPRIEFQGALYHVITRGNQRQKIYKGLTDYQKYLQLLERYKDRYPFFLYAYVLMTNHVHLLIEMRDTPLSKILQGINQSYTMYFNRKYGTVGHLFQGRYKAILCDRDAYLLSLVKYIHYNPIRTKMAKSLGMYPWSSHHAYWVRKGFRGLVDTDFVLGLFSTRRGVARRRYRAFIENEEGLKREEVYSTVDQRIQGDEEFVERVLAQYGGEGSDKGRRRGYSLSQIGSAVEKLYGISAKELRSSRKTRQISFGRKVFSLMARECGYRCNEVAAYLNKDPSGMTVHARAGEKLSIPIKELRKYLDQISIIQA